MTPDTYIRTQIAILVYAMTNAVLFGAGLVVVLMVPALNASAGLWIALVVATSLIVSAPVAWLIAPRLRARYWRQRQSAPQLLAPTRSF
jgi:hypothetical protein